MCSVSEIGVSIYEQKVMDKVWICNSALDS